MEKIIGKPKAGNGIKLDGRMKENFQFFVDMCLRNNIPFSSPYRVYETNNDEYSAVELLLGDKLKGDIIPPLAVIDRNGFIKLSWPAGRLELSKIAERINFFEPVVDGRKRLHVEDRFYQTEVSNKKQEAMYQERFEYLLKEVVRVII